MTISSSRSASTRLTLTLAGGALVATACGAGGYAAAKAGSGSAAPAAQTTHSATAVTVGVHTGGRYGSYLTDARGRSLYMFAADTAGKSACTGSCATYWPPLLGMPAQPASAAVMSTKLGTIRRSDGTTQVTYSGHPLYLYIGDGKAGDTKGQGLNLSGGKWWLLSPAGNPIAGAPKPTSSSTGGSGYGGYGGYGNG